MPEANDQFNRAQQDGSRNLSGRTAVVTGSSVGIGRAIALRLAAAGAAVHLHCRARKDEAEDVSRSIRELGSDSTVAVADLSNPQAVDAFAIDAWNWRDGVDIWVNCAGADVLTGSAATATFEEKLEMLWKVDVVATMRLSRWIGQRMRERSTGQDKPAVLNVGWDQAQSGMGGDSGEMFAAIKGAVIAFSKSLAKSLAPDVRVNCVAPGWIKTAWGGAASEYWQERARRESLLGRWGTPEDVAGAAHFLVSPGSAFTTGHVLPVNGGFRGSVDTEDRRDRDDP